MTRINDPDKTRQLIMDASLELFSEKGYDNATMQDIMELSGMSKGAIYYHFKDKAAIYRTLCNDLCGDTFSYLIELISDDSLSAQEVMDRFLECAINSPTKRKLLRAEWGQKNPDFLQQTLTISLNQCAPLIAQVIKRGIQEGAYTAADPECAAEMICLCIDIWLNPTASPASRERMLQRMEMALQVFQLIGAQVISQANIAALRGLLLTNYEEG